MKITLIICCVTRCYVNCIRAIPIVPNRQFYVILWSILLYFRLVIMYNKKSIAVEM